jgi:Glycoside hydrolase family 44
MVRSWRKVAYGVQLAALMGLVAFAGSGSAKLSSKTGASSPASTVPSLAASANLPSTASSVPTAGVASIDSPSATDLSSVADGVFAAPFPVETIPATNDQLLGASPAPAQVSEAGIAAPLDPATAKAAIAARAAAKAEAVRNRKKRALDPTISATGKATVVVYDNNALGNGWEDMGWSSSRELGAGPAKIEMGDRGGWIIGHLSEPIHAASLEFSYQSDKSLGAFLMVTVANELDESADVQIPASKAKAGEWINVRVPVAKLNSQSLVWDRIRFRPARAVARPTVVAFRNIRFTGAIPVAQVAKRTRVAPIPVPADVATPTTPVLPDTSAAVALNPSVAPAPAVAPAAAVPVVSATKPATKPTALPKAVKATTAPSAPKVSGDTRAMSIDCLDNKHKISPYIYGIGFSGASYLTANPANLGATINRWGGNVTSRYNFDKGNVWSTASDYFFRNVELSAGNTFEAFAAANAAAGRANAVTLPTMGWVAKDGTSYSYPVSVYGAQQQADGDAGNGKSPSGKDLAPPDPKTTSIASTPESVAGWVSRLKGRTAMYFLDNEPELWYGTHRDVHPQPAGYDELLDKTIKYGAAVRAADPTAVIAGPSSFGSWAYFYSGADNAGGLSNAPDRRAHGNVPFLEWYLRNVRAAEKKTGKKILDVLDVHFYPQAEGMFGWGEKTDPEHAARRIRQTRGIWDPTYTDESWVGDQEYGKLALIPRMKKIIAENAPGLGFSVGEWNFGAEDHISGALATAEVLGRFGQGDVYSAFYWTAPPENSPTFWAFRAFRNYDGAGSAFLNNSVGTTMAKDTSLFASTNDQGTQLTAVVLNLDPQKAVSAQISLTNCKGVKSAKAYTYTGGPSGFSLASPGASATSMSLGVAPYSITVIRADLG